MTAPLLDLLVALAAVAWLLYLCRPALVAARMLQIEEYESGRFLRWGAARAWLLHRAVLAGVAITLPALVAAVALPAQAGQIVAAAWCAASLVAALLWTWTPAKKALVLTSRMRRLLAAALLLAALPAAVEAVLITTGGGIAAAALAVALAFAPALSQMLLVAAVATTRPLEALIRRRYLLRARARLAAFDPNVIAVAGSYGKTSTKHILAQLLQPFVTTLPTRKSFNTLMGVTRVINEDLRPEHRVFIVEMDAYAPGEIASICALVHPSTAVITSVGPQHLERFHTMERIEDALYETVAALPSGGTAFIQAADAPTASLARRARADGRQVVTYGIDDGAGSFDVSVRDVHVDGTGARFRWRWSARELECDVAIPLLGAHQVLNTAAALAVVVLLGHSLQDAATAAASLEPVEHRLQPLHTGGPLTVIDDSYNANPVGVHNGLDVLQAMSGGRKILVTPGLVELGAVEDDENRRYGEHAATVCDEVIVMDARPAAALCAGLAAGGLGAEHIHVVQSLAEATAAISRLGRTGDVVLFANDLPDTYLAAS